MRCSIVLTVCKPGASPEVDTNAELGNDPSTSKPGRGDIPGHFALVKACEAMLNTINIIAPNLKWDEKDDNDPYATGMLAARLRAKFYGARVITYRDFVLQILQQSFDAQNRDSFAGSSDPETPTDPIIIQYAEQCIKALIKSTVAFHGVVGDVGRDRLIVTNIWGTVHA